MPFGSISLAHLTLKHHPDPEESFYAWVRRTPDPKHARHLIPLVNPLSQNPWEVQVYPLSFVEPISLEHQVGGTAVKNTG